MRPLLVPRRISLALRTATSRPVSRGEPTPQRASKQRGRVAAPAVASAAATPAEQLQQLWELSKVSRDEMDVVTKTWVEEVSRGEMSEKMGPFMSNCAKNLGERNDFESISKFLEGLSQILLERKEVLNHKDHLRLFDVVLWAAANAKSLGALPQSLLNWINESVQLLPEPIPAKKESIMWLLSIVRDDLPMLEKLQKETSAKGKIGPDIERENTLSHAALAYLEAGKEEEFRSLWTSSGIAPLGGDDTTVMQSSATLHHALLRRAGSGKSDPAMLRWYAQSLAASQRTPIPEKPQFESMMVPLMRSLGGKIEKWRKNDARLKKLRKWRDDYGDSELEKLRASMLDCVKYEIVEKHRGNAKDLSRLLHLLDRLDREKEMKRDTIVIDWLNFMNTEGKPAISSIFPSCSLVVVGREKSRAGSTPNSPKESERIKVMNVTEKREKTQEVDDLCSMVLAVATHGHFLTNDKTRPHILSFYKYLQSKSMDVSLSILLKNYLNDAVLRHAYEMIQPAVDHSRAAQYIDVEKKELAFTVSRTPKGLLPDNPYKEIDYYSLHID